MSKKNKNKNKNSHQGNQARAQQQQHYEPSRSPQPSQSSQQAPSQTQRPQVRSLEQERAADALGKIKNRRGDASYYVSYVSALPAVIVTNGLGQALVMLLAKAKGERNAEHYHLYSDLASWLSECVEGLRSDRVDDVVEKLMQGDQALYVRAQTEAMAYLHWLKQFARAYLKEKEGQGD